MFIDFFLHGVIGPFEMMVISVEVHCWVWVCTDKHNSVTALCPSYLKKAYCRPKKKSSNEKWNFAQPARSSLTLFG